MPNTLVVERCLFKNAPPTSCPQTEKHVHRLFGWKPKSTNTRSNLRPASIGALGHEKVVFVPSKSGRRGVVNASEATLQPRSDGLQPSSHAASALGPAKPVRGLLASSAILEPGKYEAQLRLHQPAGPECQADSRNDRGERRDREPQRPPQRFSCFGESNFLSLEQNLHHFLDLCRVFFVGFLVLVIVWVLAARMSFIENRSNSL